MKRGLIVQGGGSWGAFSSGRICNRKKAYDVAIGYSTGALIVPFALLNEYSILQNCYTGVSNSDIYSKFPFWKNGIPKIQVILWALLRQKRGITDSKPLRELIKKNYTEQMHESIPELGKELHVTVCALNANRNSTIYCKSIDHSYDDFCDLIWASTLIPGLFEPMQQTNQEGSVIDYCDGGTLKSSELKVAIGLGCDEIDVFAHERYVDGYKPVGKNWIHNLLRAVMLQRQDLNENDLLNLPSCKVNFNYLPYYLKEANLYEFDKAVMTKWFDEGFNFDQSSN